MKKRCFSLLIICLAVAVSIPIIITHVPGAHAGTLPCQVYTCTKRSYNYGTLYDTGSYQISIQTDGTTMYVSANTTCTANVCILYVTPSFLLTSYIGECMGYPIAIANYNQIMFNMLNSGASNGETWTADCFLTR